MLRMRSVRSQPVAPSSVAEAIPAPVILRKSLRVSLRFLTKQERTTQQCDLQAEGLLEYSMRSIMAVGIGLLLAVLGLLVVQGIFAPVLTRLFGSSAGPVPPARLARLRRRLLVLLRGMAASYKAPSRHRLHGVLVVPVAFVLSLVLNLVLGKGFLPGVDGAWAAGLVAIFLIVSCAASYVGPPRQALNAHNRRSRGAVGSISAAQASPRLSALQLSVSVRRPADRDRSPRSKPLQAFLTSWLTC